ncbi:hypothetical protein CY35_16G093500 [Sphagnum magellanicum]|nr:hypothetical protein CY35_16G093500 [Sphagnum magellanicum]
MHGGGDPLLLCEFLSEVTTEMLSRGTRNKSSYTKHTKHRPHASKWVLLCQPPDHDKKLGKFLLRKSDAKFHSTDGDGSDSMIQRGVANLEPSLVPELPELSADHIADSYPAPINEFTPVEQCLGNTPDFSVAAELGEETQVPYERIETCMLKDAPPCCLKDYLTSVERQLIQGEEDGPTSD